MSIEDLNNTKDLIADIIKNKVKSVNESWYES